MSNTLDQQQILDERRELIINLGRLRYSGALMVRQGALQRAAEEFTEAEFLMEVNLWLQSFCDILVAASDTTTDMAKELHDLRSQRKAIRDFLGLPTTPGEPTA
jgi:hypothetical protein